MRSAPVRIAMLLLVMAVSLSTAGCLTAVRVKGIVDESNAALLGEQLLQEYALPEVPQADGSGKAEAWMAALKAQREAAIQKKDMLGNEIKNLRQRLSNVTIIDDLVVNTDRVALGTKVTLYDLDTDQEVVYQILSGDDAPFYEHAISARSPIARGLIGKEEEDEVKIKVPAGIKSYEIVKIERFS